VSAPEIRKTAWPEPYLQPDPREDCGYYTAAYIARCLGHPDVTAGQVKAWRAETTRHETYFADGALGAQVRRFWDESEQESLGIKQRNWFWLGPGLEGWVRGWLLTGWIAHVNVHRISEMGHAVALLGCTADGVQLMDSITGFITEPWDWFLGPGPKAGRGDWPGAAPDSRAFYGCHFIEGWYRR
jgi:hypothetical protein